LRRKHAMTILGEVGEQSVDLLLSHRVMVALFADVDAAGVAARHLEDGLGDQAVVDDDVGLLHEPQARKVRRSGSPGPAPTR
jgi:hypothetical protein